MMEVIQTQNPQSDPLAACVAVLDDVRSELAVQLDYEARLKVIENPAWQRSAYHNQANTRTSTHGYMAAVMIAITRASRWHFDLQAFRQAMLRGAATCLCAVLWADRVMADKAAEVARATAEKKACANCGATDAEVLAAGGKKMIERHQRFYCDDECFERRAL